MTLGLGDRREAQTARLAGAKARRTALVAVAVVITIAAAAAVFRAGAAISSSSARQSKPLTMRQTLAEYRREAAGLRLAAGWRWPADPGLTSKGIDGAPMRYETGYGRTRADALWFCSWASAYLTARPGSFPRRRAVAELQKVRATFFFTTALVPPDRPGFAAMLDGAAAGRSSELGRYSRLNCPRRLRAAP